MPRRAAPTGRRLSAEHSATGLTRLINVDPNECHISLSRQADAALERLEVCSGLPHRERRRCVVEAAYCGDIEPLAELQETHFLAKATVAGKPCVLLCLSFDGSPHGDKARSMIVRGVFTSERAAELKAIGKGFSPFVNEINGRQARKNGGNESDDRAS